MSDRTIQMCVRGGARSADDVGASCGAGTACGGCRPTIEGLVRTLCAPPVEASGDGAAAAQSPRRRASGGG